MPHDPAVAGARPDAGGPHGGATTRRRVATALSAGLLALTVVAGAARLAAEGSGSSEAVPAIASAGAGVLAGQPAQRLTRPDAVAQDAFDGIDGVWLRLAECESNGRWDYNGPSGFDGGLQFHPQTWRAFDGTEFAPAAWMATPKEQVTVAERVLAVQGWNAWPTCSRRLGLR